MVDSLDACVKRLHRLPQTRHTVNDRAASDLAIRRHFGDSLPS